MQHKLEKPTDSKKASAMLPPLTIFALDVDDTLITRNDQNELIINEEMLRILKKNHIKKVVFKTRMDVKEASYYHPSRLPIIECFKKQGIEVTKVMTPLDVMQKDAGEAKDGFKMGDTYGKLMLPVEFALEKMKEAKVTAKQFADYQHYYINKTEVESLQYLIEQKLIDGNKTYSKKDETALINAIDQHLLKTYAADKGMKKTNIDFVIMTSKLLGHLLHYTKENKTTLEILDIWKAEVEKLKTTMPSHNDPGFMAAMHFFDQRCSYRNQDYFSFTTLVNKKKTELDHTKGHAYDYWMQEEKFSANTSIIFVDDNKKEHASVAGAHVKSQYKHHFTAILPPTNVPTMFTFGVPSSQFEKNLYPIMLSQPFRKSFYKSAFHPDTYFNECVTQLYAAGQDAVKLNNHIGALRYFELAYLLFNQTYLPIAMKDTLLTAIMTSKAEAKKGKKYFDNSHLDELYRDVIKIGGINLVLLLIELNVELHKKSHPQAYKAALISFWSAPQQVDSDFQNKIINKMRWIAALYPQQKNKCLRFLEEVKKPIKSKIYQDVIEGEINLLKEGKLSQPGISR